MISLIILAVKQEKINEGRLSQALGLLNEYFAVLSKVNFVASTVISTLNIVWENHVYSLGAHFLCVKIVVILYINEEFKNSVINKF